MTLAPTKRYSNKARAALQVQPVAPQALAERAAYSYDELERERFPAILKYPLIPVTRVEHPYTSKLYVVSSSRNLLVRDPCLKKTCCSSPLQRSSGLWRLAST